ncbi:MAG: TonB family protein [candidate division WOR-3 bacterium]|nr:TonB family protein [candidate division WOR-3 bacterium]
MRTGALLCLLLASCGLRSVDVVMEPTSTPGVFGSNGVGIITVPIPKYPEYVRMAGIEGQNRISLRFTAGWTAESVQVAVASGNQWLDDSACYAAAGTVLEPAPSARLRTPIYSEINYSFTLYRVAASGGACSSPDSGKQALVEITKVRVWSR